MHVFYVLFPICVNWINYCELLSSVLADLSGVISTAIYFSVIKDSSH